MIQDLIQPWCATALAALVGTAAFHVADDAAPATERPPTPATVPATTQSGVDRAELIGKWVNTYKVGETERTITRTFNDDGSFEEHDSNWGRNWGDWRIEGDGIHLRWVVRGGFQGVMKVKSQREDELVVVFAGSERTFTRVRD